MQNYEDRSRNLLPSRTGDHFRWLLEKPFLWAIVSSLLILIFVADTITDLEIAVAVLYVAVVLLSVQAGRPAAIVFVGITCVILTVVSFFTTTQGAEEAGLLNCSLSIIAIAATTYLAVKIETVEVKARQARSELARMSRVMIIGELGASIAHEVSQPITAISANGSAALRWLSASPSNESEAQSALTRIISDAARAGEVIGRVRRLVERGTPTRERVDIAQAVTEVLGLVTSEIRKNDVLLRIELATNLPLVMGDRIQLQQVVLNFILNAVEAMAQPSAEVKELFVRAAADKKKITVSVRDTGVGVPVADMDKMFDAFYTTKPTGTGMGLAISRSIIEAHGGQIYAAANFPRGMVLGFTLPFSVGNKG